jgi:hypothetical protein
MSCYDSPELWSWGGRLNERLCQSILYSESVPIVPCKKPNEQDLNIEER